MKKHFLFATTAATLLSLQSVQAQNTSPYWSLVGNSNASATSKLGTTTATPLNLTTSNLTRLRIAADGKVGIGTTNPQQRFHTEGPTNLNIFVSTTAVGPTSGAGMIGYVKGLPTAAGNRLGYFLLGSRGGAENNYNAAGIVGYASGAWSAGSSHPAYLAFETTPSGSTTRAERLRIAADGNVGIGTTSPSWKLHVNGRGAFENGLSVFESGIYSVHTTGNGVEGYGNTTFGIGLYGIGYTGVYGSGNNNGVYGTGSNAGVYGVGYYGLVGQSNSSAGYGVYAYNGSVGVYGSGSTRGVYGYSSTETGVYGYTGGNGTNQYGVYGYNASYGYGVRGYCYYGAGVYGSSNSGYAGYFSGNVFSSGSYVGSDRKLKKNITDFTSAMDIINKLQPKSYEFRQDANYKLMHLPEGKHYGLIAQDLEQVLPTLVKDSKFDPNIELSQGVKLDPEDKSVKQQDASQPKADMIDFKAVNYTELIPIMVKGMQEQAELIKQQQKQIDNLESMINKLGGNNNIVTGIGSLSQNTPNPARASTRISYSIPSNNNSAQLLLIDNLGKTIKAISLNGSGYVNLDVVGLSSGVYNYSLLVNGRIVETKKLEVLR